MIPIATSPLAQFLFDYSEFGVSPDACVACHQKDCRCQDEAITWFTTNDELFAVHWRDNIVYGPFDGLDRRTQALQREAMHRLVIDSLESRIDHLTYEQ